MDLQLDILDINRNLLNVSNTPVAPPFNIQLDAATSDLVVLASGVLLSGNTYRVTFDPATGGAGVLGTGTTTLTSPQDGALSVLVSNAILLNGGFVDITLAADITDITISVLSSAGDYNEDIIISGENITITLDDGVSPPFIIVGQNSITQALADNSQVSITVNTGGYYTYTNTINVYHNDVSATVLLIPVITDPLDVNYRRPYPNFFYILEPCSFNVHIYDGQAAPFGTISYEQNGLQFSNGQRNVIYDTCIPDIISITQRIIVNEQASSCGGIPAVVFNVSYTINGIQTTEHRPNILLDNAFRCCIPKDELLTVLPSILDMNAGAPHDTCVIGTDPSVQLIYTLTTPSNQTVALATYSAAQIAAGPLASLGFAYTPTELGTYTLSVSLTNCCATVVTTYAINICDSWEITNTDCNKLSIVNLSSVFTLTYTLKKLNTSNEFELVTINGIIQENIVMGANAEVILDAVEDNIYTLDLLTSAPGATVQERIFLLDCNIKKCKKAFLIALNCATTIACENRAKRADLLADYNYFKALEEIIYNRWNKWIRQQTIYPTFSVNDIMEQVLSTKELMTAIADICDDCITVTDKDCGC